MPGLIVRELPVKLTSQNNVEHAPDGRLFAAGYDGRFQLLRDTDGNGLEDTAAVMPSLSNGLINLAISGDPAFNYAF